MKEILLLLGLNTDEISIITNLIEYGPQSILSISRNTNINRTNLYRIIEELSSKGYVLKSPEYKKGIYSSLTIDELKNKVEEKTKETQTLNTLFKQNIKELNNLYNKRTAPFQVQFYNNQEQIKQMLWNVLSSKETIRSFGYRSTKEAVGIKFLTEWFNESQRRGQSHKMIASKETYEMKHNATEGEKYKFDKPWRPNFFIKRYLPENMFPILYETFIYNDVYSILQWKDDKVFGIEIVNPVVVEQERYIFDFLWEKAIPY